MKKSTKFALAGLLSLTLVSVGAAADGGYILRTDPSSIGKLASQFGLKVEKELSKNGLYLVRPPDVPGVVQAIKSHPAVTSMQDNVRVGLPEASGGAKQFNLQTVGGKPGAYLNQTTDPGTQVQGVSGTVLPSYFLYMNQPAILKINTPLDLRTSLANKYGAGVRVGVIDTWVDGSNKVLASSIDNSKAHGAYDCINDRSGGTGVVNQETSPFIDQETSPFIDQETSPFIDGSGTILVNQETSPFIDQETSPFIDQETSPFIDAAPAYGHGTMVAGLVHRIAPGATLVPIRAFHNTGAGSIADVIQGIYYAVDVAKVDVLSMSFSTLENTPELEKALQHAEEMGVICVASVANRGQMEWVYPAAYDGSISVAATNYADGRASFSDFARYIVLAAPGVDITSTYPRDTAGRDHWAMCSGASFSTPLVAATVAVLKGMNWTGITIESADDILQKAADPVYSPDQPIGAGRLNVGNSIAIGAGQHGRDK